MVFLGHFRRSLALCALAGLATNSHADAAAASSSSSGSQAIAVGDLAWVDCGAIPNAIVNTVVQTECTTFVAPLCHAGVCEDAQNRNVNVNIRRIRATNAVASTPSVWLLQGGAGTTSAGCTLQPTQLTLQPTMTVRTRYMYFRKLTGLVWLCDASDK